MTDEEREERFWRAVRDGAEVYMHPDTLAEFTAKMARGKPVDAVAGLATGVTVHAVDFFPRGRMMAMDPLAPVTVSYGPIIMDKLRFCLTPHTRGVRREPQERLRKVGLCASEMIPMTMRGVLFLAFVILVVIPVGLPLLLTRGDWREALPVTGWCYVAFAACAGTLAVAICL